MIENGACVMDRRMTVPRFVIATDIEDSVIVLNLNTKRYYILNRTAGQIWHAIVVGKSESEIAGLLFSEYNATREHIISSVARIFDTLEKAKLVE